MNAKHTLSLLLMLFIGSLTTFADSPNEVKDRMAKRQGAVAELLKSELVGENNKALLEVRGSLNNDQQKIVSDENSDRKRVYSYIAHKTKTDISKVQEQRAKQIADRAKGIWVQLPSGKWVKK